MSLILLGLAGTLLPVLPGTPLILTGLIVAAWIDDFQRVGWITILFLSLLTVLAIAVDYLASALGAKTLGASKYAMIGAALGALVGLLFGLVGVLIAPFIGAVLGELIYRQGNFAQAGKAGLGAWLGLLFGTVAKLVLALMMIGTFTLSYWL